jgi:hypothetical protein
VPAGALMNVYEQLDGETLPGWFREWVDEEEAADVLRTFGLAPVPGLLQIEEYAHALLPDDQGAVAWRMDRQKILASPAHTACCARRGGALSSARRAEGHAGPVGASDRIGWIATIGSDRTIGEEPPVHGRVNIATVDGSEVGYVETVIRGIVTRAARTSPNYWPPGRPSERSLSRRKSRSSSSER